MNNYNRFNRILVACVMTIVSQMVQTTPAKAASSVAKWLGLDKVGSEGLEKAGQSAEASARTLAFSISEFTVLMDEYHNGTAEEKAGARRIVRAAFPGAIVDEQPINLEMAIDFPDLDTSKNPLTVDIWPLQDSEVPTGKAREAENAIPILLQGR